MCIRDSDIIIPRHDRAVGVLIEDLAQRGMLENTLVVTAGEFGRTPKINGNAGRDHWPQAQSILVAGGGYRGGQVIGTTDKDAAHPTSRKVDVADFCRIVYRGIGMTGHNSVIGAITSEAERGSFLSRFQLVVHVASIVTGLAIALLLRGDPPLLIYTFILGAGLVSGFLASIYLLRLP